MPTLYNLHSDPNDLGLGYRITKFVDGDPEGSYIVTLTTCECPAGHRPSCRHRKMLPLMLERNLLDSFLFWDFDRGLSCDMNGKASRVTIPAIEPAIPSNEDGDPCCQHGVALHQNCFKCNEPAILHIKLPEQPYTVLDEAAPIDQKVWDAPNPPALAPANPWRRI